MAKLQRECISLLESRGYEIIVERHFGPVRNELGGIGKTILTPNLDPLQNDFTTENAFCLTLRHGADLVAVVGVRLDRVGAESADRFWAQCYSRLYPTNAKRGAVTPQASDLLYNIKGKIAYIGDLHFRPESRGHLPTLMCFVHYAHTLSYGNWRPDWIYSFQRRADVLKGYTDKYGFNNRHAGALVWNDPPSYRSSSEYLATLSRVELERLAEYYSEFPELLVSE